MVWTGVRDFGHESSGPNERTEWRLADQLPRSLFFCRAVVRRLTRPRGGSFARLVAARLRWAERFRFVAFCVGSGFLMTTPWARFVAR